MRMSSFLSVSTIAERFVRSIKEECLECVTLFGERALRWALSEYETKHLKERNDQGRGNTDCLNRLM